MMTTPRALCIVLCQTCVALLVLLVLASQWSVSAQNTITLLNTRYNAESTGNVLTMPFTVSMSACVAEEGATPYNAHWDTIAASDPVDTAIAGTNVQSCQADFVDSETDAVYTNLALPADWTGTVGTRIFWRSTATTGNVVWQVASICVADGETLDPAYNAASTVTDATQGTASRFNTASIASVTITGCAAGEMLYLRVFRDPTHASDTIAATASLLGVEVSYRRAM
jgi:hypothetical protein